MKTKTKLEIIDETEAAYSDPKNRAFDRVSGRCFYFDALTKNKCAVGRCIKNYKPSYEGMSISSLVIDNKWGTMDIDSKFFKSEYKGHNIVFWQDLQKFHDREDLFTKTSISPAGRKYLKMLRKKYK